MPHYIRPQIPGATVFFTVALAHPGSDLLLREIEALRQAVRLTRHDRPFQINAWVVLPDHMHCIWTLPPGDADFSTRMGAIKARFSRMVSGRVGFNPTLRTASMVKKGESGIWQRRFWDHHIRNPDDLATHLQACWNDPVRHGLVTRAEDWPFSSFHRDHAQAQAA
jgi:putative transposase